MSKNHISHTETKLPKLAAPGAGVPWHHRLLFQYIVGPFVAGRTSWTQSEQTFHKINQRILIEIENLDEKQLSMRILVPPQMGLEDSSRFWSVAMCLEHMVIVGEAIMKGVLQLTSGEVPPLKVDIAAVKPLGLMPPLESVEEFKYFVSDDYKKFLNSLKNKNSNLTLKHPWFGDFTAQQWFWLLSTHQAIHLKQIREIKRQFSVI